MSLYDIPKDLEAARDGIRIVLAEAERLAQDLERADAEDSVESFARLLRRAGRVSSQALAVTTTLAAHLPDLVKADREAALSDGRIEGREEERMAWSEGLQAGMEIAQPDPGQH